MSLTQSKTPGTRADRARHAEYQQQKVCDDRTGAPGKLPANDVSDPSRIAGEPFGDDYQNCMKHGRN